MINELAYTVAGGGAGRQKQRSRQSEASTQYYCSVVDPCPPAAIASRIGR